MVSKQIFPPYKHLFQKLVLHYIDKIKWITLRLTLEVQYLYSSVHITLNKICFQILKKPFIVQKWIIHLMKAMLIFFGKKILLKKPNNQKPKNLIFQLCQFSICFGEKSLGLVFGLISWINWFKGNWCPSTYVVAGCPGSKRI